MAIYELNGTRPTLPQDGSVWLAPSADVIGDARLSPGVSVWFGAVIRADNTPIVVGVGSNVQDGATLHSDPDSPLVIGSGVTIGHNAILHGCTVGDNVLIGMGATLLNGAIIGDDCLVGAGALVKEGAVFPPGSLIVGSPAKVVRPCSPQMIEALRRSAAIYQQKGRLYARSLVRLD